MTSVPTRLIAATRPLTLPEIDAADARANLFLLGPTAAAALDARARSRLAARRSMTVVALGPDPPASGVAAALLADFAVAPQHAWLPLSAAGDREVEADLEAGLVWRCGRRALAILLGNDPLPVAQAIEAGLLDALVPVDEDPLHWLIRRFEGRSLLALQSAAALIRTRGGDAAERAEFARLFAAGEPQHGLRSFLSKQTPGFRETIEVEML